MTVIWFAACIEEDCARFGKKLTGDPARLVSCSKCQGPLEWEERDIPPSGPAVTADPDKGKKRALEDGDPGNEASINAEKKRKGADGLSQTQDLSKSTPTGDKSSVVETPPYRGVECDLVQRPEAPVLHDAVYCLLHHSTQHQTA